MSDGTPCGSSPRRAGWSCAPCAAEVDPNGRTVPFEPLPECRETRLRLRIVLGVAHQQAMAPHPFRLLRLRASADDGHRFRGVHGLLCWFSDQTLPVIRDDHRKPLARYGAALGRARSRIAPPSYTTSRDRTALHAALAQKL
jgi:hypothetical protein